MMNNKQSEPPPRFTEHVDQMNQTAHQLLDEAKSAADQFERSVDLKGRVERHPYGMVLAAVGVGYVLGGGLFTPFTGRLVRLGLKLAALPLVKDELLGIAEAALDSYSNQKEGGGDR
jgi:hypothetical protein